MRSTFAGLFVAGAMVIAIPTNAQESCTCHGDRVDHFQGGDGKPLEWLFEVYLVKKSNVGPSLYCYLKRVTNRSNLDVYAVRWNIANYRQENIYAGKEKQTCPQYIQDLASAPLNGPLNFGISSQSYDTTVKAPLGGWQSPTAGGNNNPYIGAGYEWLKLESQFAFSTVGREGQHSSGLVAVESGVNFNYGGRASFYYVVTNRGPQPVSVFINLSTSKELIKEVPIADNFVSIASNESKKYAVDVSATVIAEPATIIIRNESGGTVLADRAGVFAIAGGYKSSLEGNPWGSP